MFAKWRWAFIERHRLARRLHGFRAHHSSFVADTQFEGAHTLGPRVIVAHSSLGFGTYLAANSEVIRSDIGRYCSIGQHVLIGGMDRHPTDRLSTHPCFYSGAGRSVLSIGVDASVVEEARTWIGHDVWIGARSVIVSGVRVGAGAIIGAGAVVVKDVAPYSVVGGVPARVLRQRFQPELVDALVALNWWDWPLEKIRRNVALFSLPEAVLLREIMAGNIS